jgi:glycosyltransferase involved in cell wall biosynthesis
MLTVVIPAFDAEAHLGRLFRSLDDRPHWEVVIVDDGSSDGTREVARSWLATRAHGKLIELLHVGPGRARQAGLDAANGDFIMFADADDEVVSGVMQDLYETAMRERIDVAIAGYDTRSGPLAARQVRQRSIRRVPAQRVLTGRAAIWGKLYRTSFLRDRGVSFPDLRSADDVIFSWRVATSSPKCLETSSVGYLYWIDPHEQLTRDPQYFLQGPTSLAMLWREAKGMPTPDQCLALYAYVTGTAHILKKSRLEAWPPLLGRAVGGLWRGRTRSREGLRS